MATPSGTRATPARRTSRSREAFEALRHAIVSADLAAGEVVNEGEWAERLGMSRTPIREALSRLVQEGLVERVPNRGTFVREVEATGELPPVQKAAPDPGPDTLTGLDPVAAPVPDQPTMQVSELVNGVTAEMQKITPAVEKSYTTVAKSSATASPAAMRKAAMSSALSKVGKPYRWGASGPNAFDCSGLVKWSFAQAGRSLPRTSRAQSVTGAPVSRANLQPGDLVFFYKPISHVGIYIGNNKVVHASRKGQPVKVSDMSRMKFTKAVRP